MKIIVDENNEIVGYATNGDINGSIEFDGAVPSGFFENFVPRFYLLEDNAILLNPNYQEPTVDIPIPEPSGPSAEMLAINALGIQLAKHLAGGD